MNSSLMMLMLENKSFWAFKEIAMNIISLETELNISKLLFILIRNVLIDKMDVNIE